MLIFEGEGFLKANYLCKVTRRTEGKTMMREAQTVNFRDLSLSCCGHSA